MAQPESSSRVDAGGHGERGMTAAGSGGPTALRILLGAQLRRLREGRRITLDEAGDVIRASGSKVSRLETGRVGFKDRDIADLLTFYGVDDEQQRDAARGAGPQRQRPRLVARLFRRAADLVRGLRRPGGGRDQHPGL